MKVPATSMLFGTVLVTLLSITGCQNVSLSTQTPPDPTATFQTPISIVPSNNSPTAKVSRDVFALLRDNSLIATRVPDGAIIFEQHLAPPPIESTSQQPGHLLALSKDETKLIVLLTNDPRSDNGNGSSLVVADISTMRVVHTYQLTPSVTFHALAVGPTSGRIYLFGNKDKSAIVAMLDLTTGLISGMWTAREADGYDYEVYQGAVAYDEQRVFLSYHSADVGGIDWFDVTSGGLRRCASPGADRTCLSGHGGFTLYGDLVLVATGSNVILEEDQNGEVRRGFNTHLSGNHLIEFVVDQSSNRMYAVGGCDYTGGFAAMELSDGGTPTTPQVVGDWTWLATPVPPPVLVAPLPSAADASALPCGDRVEYASNQVLVVTQTPGSIGGGSENGALAYLDARNGKPLLTIPTPAWPLDVLAIPAASTPR